jgi:DNA-binding phage protein
MQTLKVYRSYNFRDKDPIIDAVRTVIQTEGVSYAAVHEASGVSVTTLYNWFDGEVKRPQFATVMAVVRSLGYDLTLAKAERKLTTAKIVKFPIQKRAAAA